MKKNFISNYKNEYSLKKFLITLYYLKNQLIKMNKKDKKY